MLVFQSACDGQPKKLLDGALERARGAFGGSRDRLLSKLQSAHPEERAAAVKALAEQGAKGAAAVVAHLDPRGQGPSTGLGTGSLELLEALKGATLAEAAVERLAPFLSCAGIESALAAQLLGKSGARSAVPALLKYLDEPTAFGRRQALIALGEVGDRRAAKAAAEKLRSMSEVR